MQSRSREFNVLYYVHLYITFYHLFYILFSCLLVSLSLLLVMISVVNRWTVISDSYHCVLAEGTQPSATSPQSTEADDRAHREDHPQTGMSDLLGRLSVASNRYVSLFLVLLCPVIDM